METPAPLLGEPLPVELMNTIWADRHGVHDALSTTAHLQAWLAAVFPDRPAPEPGPDELARVRTLRDALRRLAATLTNDTRPAASSATTDVHRAVADVNSAAQQAPTWPQLAYRDGELNRTTAGITTPAKRALSSIARDAIDLLAGDEPIALRACHAPGCVLYFVKGHPRREWCSVACGNRARAARHYRRHRTPPKARPNHRRRPR
jgi:predicted RNA-binding Zn ribbon-like protein